MQAMNHDRFTTHLTWMRSAVLLAPLCAVACAYGVEMDRADAGEGTGGSSGGSDDTGGSPALEVKEIQAFLTQHCVKCHGAGATSGGLQDITNLERLITDGHIVPSKPGESPLFLRLTNPSNPMPPLSETARPSEQEIGLMQVWIEEGALTGEDACDNALIPFDVPGEAFNGMIATMRNDILDLAAVDRPFARYLTLTHLHNAGMCQRDLDLYRDGLAKAVNSLSREPRLVRPEPVDADKTIYRVDLRDYGWDQSANFPENNGDIWEAVVEVNPFAVRFKGLASDVLRDLAGTEVPFQTADSFIQIATGGVLDGVATNLDFYNRILAIPATLAQLQKEVTGITDPQVEIDEGRVFRVILEASGVSQWNRAYDRFGGSTIGEYLYISHDFASASGDSNLFNNPIDFKAVGGEMIFSLPNGLQGYMLTDGAGSILSVGPTNVVTDPGQRDQTVRVGISCMACHNNGTITKRDEFYDFYNTTNNKNLFSENEHKSIENLFEAPDEAVLQQDVDAERFRLALRTLTINLDNPEPIINTSWQFEDELSLTRVAAEFGVDEQSLGFDLKRLQDRVSKSFGSLANNGRLSREAFAGTYKAALCLLLKNSKEEPDEPECAQFEDGDETGGETDTGTTGAPDSDSGPTTG